MYTNESSESKLDLVKPKWLIGRTKEHSVGVGRIMAF
jgi:hypothetical protein